MIYLDILLGHIFSYSSRITNRLHQELSVCTIALVLLLLMMPVLLYSA